MDSRRDMNEEEQVILEEIVDEGEVYDELVLGESEEALYLDGEEVDVEDLESIEPGAYIQLPGGELIPASGAHQSHSQRVGQPVRTVEERQEQQRRPLQNENSQNVSNVYAVRGNQVFRVDKTASGATQLKSTTFRFPKSEPDASQPTSSGQERSIGDGRSQYAPTPFRRDGNFGFPPPSSLPQIKPKRYIRKILVGHRKPCNCTKSMCLKLYCECFANGEFCRDCNCKDCHNNLQHENERSRAIRSSLERNPNAFKPKIVSGGGAKGHTDSERLHMKGCHCKKSNCLKNYCECYEAKVACTERCKCCGCKNTEMDRMTKFRDRLGPAALLSLANVASLTEPVPATSFSEEESDGEDNGKTDPKTMPWFYLTDEVVEAATLCLVAAAEDVEIKKMAAESNVLMERVLMTEFATCLQSMITSATAAASSVKAKQGALTGVKTSFPSTIESSQSHSSIVVKEEIQTTSPFKSTSVTVLQA